ncbi:MAG: hypothetical protein P8188_19460 [Gemmatimonadota bacterium]|jgi:hypothetical protein
MPNETEIRRYRTFDPDLLTEEEFVADGSELHGGSPLDRATRYLTWGILSICLALWAVVGFVFWVPLLLRSMLQFSFALSQSMLQGTRPVEAGRILRDTVGFYRRGFTVAINAVFGPPPKKKESQVTRLTLKDLLFEIVWAGLVWYGILFLFGVIETSPVDIWNAFIGLPWAEWWRGLEETVSGWVTGAGEGSESVGPGTVVDTATS